MRVLLCAVTNGSCCLGFAVSMLRLQTALVTAPGLHVTVTSAKSLPEALARAREDACDALVCIATAVAFPASFVLRGLVAPRPFVAGVYPLPTIDWKRVANRAADPGEEMRFKGCVYNVEASTAKPSTAPGYMTVSRAGLRAVVLKREAIDALEGKVGDGASDDDVCAAWGQDILIDMDSQCAITGPAEFTGCVGFRTVLR